MQVKKFEAPTMAEALNLIKTELGPEAIILSTKKHKKGFGLLSKASVEVTAAVADKSLAKKQLTEKVVPPTTKEKIGKLPAEKQAKIFDEFTDHYTRRRDNRVASEEMKITAGNARRYIDIPDEEEASQPKGFFRSAKQAVSQTLFRDEEEETPSNQGYARNGRTAVQARASMQSSAPMPHSTQMAAPALATRSYQPSAAIASAGTESISALQEDVARLKSMLEEIKSEQTALADSKIPESSSDEVQVEFQHLLRNGIDKRFATMLIKQVSFALPREALGSSERITETLAVEVMNNIKIDDPLDFRGIANGIFGAQGNGQRVFALIGPTGVGKTTTIAKLASQAILQKNLKVGLINIDSYKVAALDQLATYAKILNVPFRQASTAVELDRALAEFKPLDLVLIDTSGRSQKDSESLTQMRTLLSECAAVRPLLIMSATTRDQELYDIINRFKIFNPTGLIFSKLDETSTFGCIYNVSQKTGLPLTYFTVGQRVPEDIETASRERVAALILDL